MNFNLPMKLTIQNFGPSITFYKNLYISEVNRKFFMLYKLTYLYTKLLFKIQSIFVKKIYTKLLLYFPFVLIKITFMQLNLSFLTPFKALVLLFKS